MKSQILTILINALTILKSNGFLSQKDLKEIWDLINDKLKNGN